MTSKQDTVMIFGYGSLMSLESLREHVPDAKNLRTAYIKGFRREFSKWDPEGWKSMYLDLAGIPFCAVDVVPDGNSAEVNGVIFTVKSEYLPDLKRREFGYRLVETPVFEFGTDRPLGTCFVFSANKRDGKYVPGEPAQERYTNLCLAAAKEHGDDFYRQFLATTHIGDKSLEEII
jgi:cation transport regulator ChaC